MANTLTINGHSDLVDSTEYPQWWKVGNAKEIEGLWEQSMYFDSLSPNCFYRVVFRVWKLKLTPPKMRMYVSNIRDYVGEGPFAATWADADESIAFAGLMWDGEGYRLIIDDSLVRGALAELTLKTAIKPVITST